jgi:hypothetical protein
LDADTNPVNCVPLPLNEPVNDPVPEKATCADDALTINPVSSDPSPLNEPVNDPVPANAVWAVDAEIDDDASTASPAIEAYDAEVPMTLISPVKLPENIPEPPNAYDAVVARVAKLALSSREPKIVTVTEDGAGIPRLG